MISSRLSYWTVDLTPSACGLVEIGLVNGHDLLRRDVQQIGYSGQTKLGVLAVSYTTSSLPTPPHFFQISTDCSVMYAQAPLLPQIPNHLFLLGPWLFLQVFDQRIPSGFGDLVRAPTLSKTRPERRAVDEDVLPYLIDRADRAITLCSNLLRCNAEKKKPDNAGSYGRRYCNHAESTT